MKVTFRVNLGSTDATRLGIDNFAECLAGAEVAVPESVAKALEKAGIIEPLPPPKPAAKPVEVRADPVVDLAADPPAETKKKTK